MSAPSPSRPTWSDPQSLQPFIPLLWLIVVLIFCTAICWLFLQYEQGGFFIELLKAVCYVMGGFGADQWLRQRNASPLS